MRELRIVGGYAPIHHACLEGQQEVVRLLAEAGADLNIKCDSAVGESPLHICCKLNMVHCGKILIDSGASLDVRDNFGNNSTFWAVSSRNFDMVKALNLPASKSASAEEFLKLTIARLGGNFKLPTVKPGKSKGGGGGKGKGKKKK